jgi:hypothetical protein
MEPQEPEFLSLSLVRERVRVRVAERKLSFLIPLSVLSPSEERTGDG